MSGKFGHFCFYYVRHASDVSASVMFTYLRRHGTRPGMSPITSHSSNVNVFHAKPSVSGRATKKLFSQVSCCVATGTTVPTCCISVFWTLKAKQVLDSLFCLQCPLCILNPISQQLDGTKTPMSFHCYVIWCHLNLLVIEVTPLNQSCVVEKIKHIGSHISCKI